MENLEQQVPVKNKEGESFKPGTLTVSSAEVLPVLKAKAALTRHTQVMQGLSVMLGMWRTSPSFSQLASVPVERNQKGEMQAEDTKHKTIACTGSN